MESFDHDDFDSRIRRILAEADRVQSAETPIAEFISGFPWHMQDILRQRAALVVFNGSLLTGDVAIAIEDQRVHAVLGLHDSTCTQTPRYRPTVPSRGTYRNRPK